MQLSTKTEKKPARYLPITLDSLQFDTVLKFDLYLKRETGYFLYRDSHLPFTEEIRQSLLERNINKLYVSSDDRERYQEYIERNIVSILENDSIDLPTKSNLVYGTTKAILEDVFSNPTVSKNIKRSQDIVEATVGFAFESERAFRNIIEVMSFDYYTFTHSVNVCIFALALARYSGIHDREQLNQLGFGALLHDVGKTKIPSTILNKQGSLSEDEFSLIKRHPKWGYELTRETDLLPAQSYLPIIEHHERENASGYPDRKGGQEIHLFSKIVSICDAFDAMTTKRVYREAKSSFKALEELYAERDCYNEELLEKFTRMLGPQGIMFT